MALVLANSYNENDATNVRDYSNSLNDGVGSNMAMVSDTFGYYADFNGTTSKIDTPTAIIGDTFSVYFEFYTGNVSNTQFIYNKTNHSSIRVIADKIDFIVDNGATTGQVTTAPKFLDPNTWYKVCCSYDGATLKIYVNDNTIEASASGHVTGLSDVNAFTFGYDGSTDYFTGRIREFRIYDEAITASNVNALMNNQQGLVVAISNHNLSVGDLVVQNNSNTRADAVVFATDTNEVRTIKMSNTPISGYNPLVRCGNRWDTDRQHHFVLDGKAATPEISIFDGVTLHSDLDSDTTKKIRVNKDGIYKNAITKTADYTVTNKDLRIYVDSTLGAFTLTLPLTPTTNKELEIIDKVGICSTYNVTINGNGNNIIGSTTISLSTNYEGLHLSWNGTQWNLG